MCCGHHCHHLYQLEHVIHKSEKHMNSQAARLITCTDTCP